MFAAAGLLDRLLDGWKEPNDPSAAAIGMSTYGLDRNALIGSRRVVVEPLVRWKCRRVRRDSAVPRVVHGDVLRRDILGVRER